MTDYKSNLRIPLLLLLNVAPAAPESENKPNIVLVLMDNFGYDEIGVYGGGVLRGAATGGPTQRRVVWDNKVGDYNSRDAVRIRLRDGHLWEMAFGGH